MITDYLITFFTTLDMQTDRQSYDVSHAIAFDEESLCVLVSMGDVRAKIRIKELDPDPVKAAEAVVVKWKATPRDELYKSLEEVR